jgi:hypothetical protein
MCWSTQVSVTFASIETLLSIAIWTRSRYATEYYVRQQWRVLPVLFCVATVEWLEAILWQDQGLSPYSNPSTCSKFNQRLTLFLWIFLLPWQPLLILYPCRRVLPKTNWLVFQAPEYLAIFFAVSHILMYTMTHVTSHSFFATTHLVVNDGFGIFHNETCTFVDTHHFHWTIAQPDTFLTPNAFTYLAVWSTCLFARPLAFVALPGVIMLLIFGLQLLYFGGSFQAGSLWCLSGIFCHFYFLFQPYIWPCQDPPSERDEKWAPLPLLQ